MTELEKFKLHYEDLPGYSNVLTRLKVYRLKRSRQKGKKG